MSFEIEEPRRMTDREMLLLSYGAMKAVEPDEQKLTLIVQIVEEHLFPVPSNAESGPGLDRKSDV